VPRLAKQICYVARHNFVGLDVNVRPIGVYFKVCFYVSFMTYAFSFTHAVQHWMFSLFSVRICKMKRCHLLYISGAWRLAWIFWGLINPLNVGFCRIRPIVFTVHSHFPTVAYGYWIFLVFSISPQFSYFSLKNLSNSWMSVLLSKSD